MLGKILLFLFSLLFIYSSSHAASSGQPAFAKLETYRDGLSNFGLRLAPDEELCKKHYGKEWQRRCYAMPGRYGEITRGIAMSPPVEGLWQWTGPNSLQFLPETPASIQPDTIYALDAGRLPLPASIKLDRSTPSFHSWPFAAQLLGLKFMIDPAPSARHMLTLSLQFNYPAPENFSLPSPEATGLALGKPEIVWNRDRMALNMAWPVLKLPDHEGIARINCGKIAQIQEHNGEFQLIKPSTSNPETIFSLRLPAKNDLFHIKKATLNPALNENLDQEYKLEIESSLCASPEKLQENLIVIQLPRANSPEAIEPFNWELAPAISPEIIHKSKTLKPVPASSGSVKSKFIFHLQADPNSYLLLIVSNNFKSASGSALSRDFLKILHVPGQQATLSFMQPGNILPLTQDGAINIHAANLDRIHWEIRKVEEPFLALMANGQNIFENGFAYAAPDMDSISKIIEGDLKLPETGPGKAQFACLNLGQELKKLDGAEAGLALLSLRGFQKDEMAVFASRLVLATRLGLLLKQSANGVYDCFAQDLESGNALQDAEILILGANGATLSSGKTDANGHFRSAPLARLKREKRPLAAIARKNGQLAWLSLADPARKMNLSEFKTGGISSFANGLNAFIFAQRGVYRPGEELNFGIIVKNGDFSPLDDDVPIWTEILDPRGVRVFGKTVRVKSPGIAECSWKAPDAAIGGKYVFNASTARDGAIIGSQAARIEEFQPDTMKLRIMPPEYTGWINADKAAATLRFRLDNLYGTPAQGRKIAASMRFSPAKFQFRGFEDYIFNDPTPLAAENQRMELPTVISDEHGEASLDLSPYLRSFPSAQARIEAEGFSGSGRAVSQTAAFLVSPAKRLLGYRPLGAVTNMQFIPAGTEAQIDLIALDNRLRKTAWEDLDFALSRKEYVTTLISDASGGYRYDETPLINPIKSWRASLPEAGTICDLPSENPGEFLLSISSQGKRIAEIPFAVAGNRLLEPGSGLAKSKIRARINKTEFESGEEVQIALGLPYDGTGLITLERDGVEAFTRFSARAGETVQTLAIPEAFEGKGYIVVSYTRSTASPAIFMNPHACAALPIMANMKKRDMGLKIRAPESVAPGSELMLEASSKEPGKALVFAVDEGIHLLTNYQQPKPLEELLGNRALNVSSLQAYDLLMPVRLNIRNSAFGGGMDSSILNSKFRNPFKRKNEPPLVFWSGIIDIGPEKRILSIAVPPWHTGKTRIYAVGASQGGAGAAAALTLVTAPLVISPSLPLAISPGDFLEGSLTIENTTENSMEIAISADYGQGLNIAAPLPAIAEIPANSSVSLPFEAHALDAPALVKMKFAITGSGLRIERESSISIRPPGIVKTSFLAGKTDKAVLIDTGRRVHDANASARIMLSPLPLPLINGFRQYLEPYPHGCAEQLTGKAFVMLAARNWFPNDEKLEKQLSATLFALRSQSGSNGVSLWPNGEPDHLLTVYAADFLLSLRAAGMGNNEDLLEQLCAIIQEQSPLNESSLAEARISAYGIWVLTRAGRITTQLIENYLQDMEHRQITGWEKDVASALIAASLKEMHISRNLPAFEKLDYSNDGWFDEYAQKALHFYILAKNFPEFLTEEQKDDFYEASQLALNSGNFTTFSASLGARALLESGMDLHGSLDEAKIDCPGSASEHARIFANGKALEFETGQCPQLKIDMPAQRIPFFWQATITGYDRNARQEKEENGISIERHYLDKNGKSVTTFNQGDEITVILEARALQHPVKDCVIADLLPGGTEMIFEKTEETQFPDKISYADRQEDRMLLFGSLDNEPLRIAYRIRAINRGEFLAPAARIEAMYDPALSAQTSSWQLRIQ